MGERERGREKRRGSVRGIAGCIWLAAGFALLLLSRNSHAFAQWYSTHLYPVWVSLLGRVMGIFPFSVSEVLLYALIAAVPATLIRLLVRWRRGLADRARLASWALGVFALAGFLFCLYAVNCGVNYHRTSFSESSGIIAEPYTAKDLKETCQWLAREVNARSKQVERDSEGVMLAEGIDREAVKAISRLAERYPELEGYFPRPKGLLCPWILSVQQLSGIYSPFTIEANYNSAMTGYNIPFTACHELSHLRGFMQEEEANFIAFLAAGGSEDIRFQYSGFLMGWRYCMNVLYQADYDAWEELRGQIAPEVEPDLAANREFWQKYDGKVAEVSNRVNDTYLKANRQSDGVRSYDRMVDLIVAYRKMQLK